MDLTRRSFLKIGFAVASAAALAGCGRPVDHALVSQYGMPEYRLPGEPVFFATTCGECGAGCGVAVRVMHGRANHVMGIPTHPLSHGNVCAHGLSALQALYHPDRLAKPLKKSGEAHQEADPKAALEAVAAALREKKPSLWIVDRLGGSAGSLLADVASASNGRIWVLDFPGSRAERMAVKGLTGKAELHHEDLATADFVVNFGGDPLAGANPVAAHWAYGRFRENRPPEKLRGVMVTFSTRMNLTAASSDKWVPVRPGGEVWAALGLAKALAAAGRGKAPSWAGTISLEDCASRAGVEPDTFERLAKRLGLARNPLVIGGFESAVAVNGPSALRLILGLNRALGRNVATWEPDLVTGSFPAGLLVSAKEALDGLKAGQFANVFIHDVDPAYLLPAGLDFAGAMAKAATRVAFAPFADATTKLCDWVIPTATWLESWGDARLDTPEGAVYGLQQPAVVAREGSRGFLEILLEAARAAGLAGSRPDTAQKLLQGSTPSMRWDDLLSRGGVWPTVALDWEPYPSHPLTPPPATANPGGPPAGTNPWQGLAPAADAAPAEAKADESRQLTLIVYPSSALGDGRYSNRPWMLELPDPMTSVPWANWVELNPAKAKELGVANGDRVTLKSSAGDVTLPVMVMPGLHPEAAAVPMGWGRSTPGHWSDVGAGVASVLEPAWQEGTGEVAWGATKVTAVRASGVERIPILDQRVNGLPRRVMPH